MSSKATPFSAKKINCPNCKKANTWNEHNKFRPFCSERCRLIDLGDWAAENHKIPTENSDQGETDSSFEDH